MRGKNTRQANNKLLTTKLKNQNFIICAMKELQRM